MTIVEQLFPGFQWAEPLENRKELKVEKIGSELHITGVLPTYKHKNHPSDLVGRYALAPRSGNPKNPGSNNESPEIEFSNANTDEKLISFVKRFGPVAATECSIITAEKSKTGELREFLPPRLCAVQEMQELRNEHIIYLSAAGLIDLLQSDFDFDRAQELIRKIATNIADWPRQWKRESSQRKAPPMWNLSAGSLKRIEALTRRSKDTLVVPEVDGHIVICELLNSFPAVVFPNPMEMHSSITYGIRPLLYSLLRRQFFFPRDFSFCANTQCRNLFNTRRTGQKFCSPACSMKQRQRTYWAKRGKKLRERRLRKRKKTKK